MTPWETRCCVDAFAKRIEAQHDHDVWIMWHGEAIHRMDKLPDIKKFLSGDKKLPSGEAQIKARFLNHQKMRENVGSR
jgi:hypothetical protein